MEKTYKHRYGDIPFEGYIDKFYNTTPFYYNNDNAIDLFVRELELDLTKGCLFFFKEILRLFLKEGALTMRKLIKYNLSKVKPFKPFAIYEEDKKDLEGAIFSNSSSFSPSFTKFSLMSDDIPMLKVLCILSNIFGGLDQLADNLNISNKDKSYENKYYEANAIESAFKEFFLISRLVNRVSPFYEKTKSKKNDMSGGVDIFIDNKALRTEIENVKLTMKLIDHIGLRSGENRVHENNKYYDYNNTGFSNRSLLKRININILRTLLLEFIQYLKNDKKHVLEEIGITFN